MKKFLLVVVVLVVAVGLFLRFSERPDPLPPESVSAALLQPGEYEVSYFDVTFVDGTRPTQANGDFAGSDQRSLKTRIWHAAGDPAAGQGPKPLLVYSHGFMSTRMGGDYLAKQFASHGYTVVAADYPLTNFSAPGDPLVTDVVNQPGDVSFLIDKMLELNTDASSDLYGRIDASRIGVMGLSLGGLTSTLVAFHPQMSDPRVRLAVSIAGPSAMFTERYFDHRELPFLMIAGDIDALVPPELHAYPLRQKMPAAALATIAGASHTGFSGPARWLRWMDNPDQLGCDRVMEQLEKSDEQRWDDLLGTPEQGVVSYDNGAMCSQQPLPEAMNVLHQHRLTSLLVTNFVFSQFAEKPAARVQYADMLYSAIPSEHAELSISVGGGSELGASDVVRATMR